MDEILEVTTYSRLALLREEDDGSGERLRRLYEALAAHLESEPDEDDDA